MHTRLETRVFQLADEADSTLGYGTYLRGSHFRTGKAFDWPFALVAKPDTKVALLLSEYQRQNSSCTRAGCRDGREPAHQTEVALLSPCKSNHTGKGLGIWQ